MHQINAASGANIGTCLFDGAEMRISDRRVEADVIVDAVQRQLAIQRDELHNVFQLVIVEIFPRTIILLQQLRDVGPMVRNQQILTEARNRFVVGEFVAAIVSFGRIRQNLDKK